MRKIILPVICACVLLAAGLCIWLLNPKPAGVTVYDADGQVLIHAQDRSQLADTPYWAYCDIAITEAAGLLAIKNEQSLEASEQALFREGFQIYTDFNPDLYKKLEAVAAQHTLEIGCAITDLKGVLLAAYSSPGKNLAATETAPYSAFKPLSVYTPAMEAGSVHWASMYEDAPYKQLEDSSGVTRGWPANASGKYSERNVDISEAIRKSLNTVAVRCLAKYGVRNSMDFLVNTLGMPLKAEAFVAETYGEEEILGSIALGYLEKGVSPVAMAGYYQIFATGGKYTKPTAISILKDSCGQLVYKRQNLERQVISPATADTMNKLLQEVVTQDGTGWQAACEDVQIAGKTGTGDDYTGNWFVGVTPGYSCAVWHGAGESNRADAIFGSIIRSIYEDDPKANRKFITHANLYPVVYCTDTGMAINAACDSIAVGYFKNQNPLPVCNVH